MNSQKKRSIARRGQFHVYILRCANGTFYTGYTSDLPKRVELHNKGRGAKYLKGKLPAVLVYAKEYRNYKSALNEEKRIKTLPRKKKEELVRKYSKR